MTLNSYSDETRYAFLGEKVMAALWDRVRQLNGKTLHTLKQGKAFEVINVQSDRIEFVPVSGNGTQRWIGREWIEQVAAMNLDESNLTPSRLSLEFPKDQNLSYIAAIVYAVTKT